MKRSFSPLACALVVVMAASAARGALSLQIGPRNGTDAGSADAVVINPGTQFFDMIFHETGTVQREGLFTYDIALDLPNGQGVSFVNGAGSTPVQIGANPAIAMTPNPASITVLENTPSRLVFNITSGNDLTDIDEGESAARIFYTVAPDAVQGIRRIVFDAANSVYGSGDPELPLSIEVDMTDAGVITFIPEPTGVAVLAVSAVFALRRHRLS